MKPYRKYDKPYSSDEWEMNDYWLARRLSYLWLMREEDSQHYLKNGFAREKQEMYESQPQVCELAQKLHYAPMEIPVPDTERDIVLTRRDLLRMKESDMEGFLSDINNSHMLYQLDMAIYDQEIDTSEYE